MKKLLFVICTTVLLASCNNHPDPTTDQNTPDPNAKNTTCYYSVQGKDSAYLKLVSMGTSVAGILNYIPYEKDKNTGSISGELHGDTIIADYKFMSEGMESTRQVVLLKRGHTLVEGYGDVEDKNGKMIYKDISKLSFSGMVLTEGECE
jgi:hypothetical protein